MAGRLILMKNTEDTVEGDCVAPGYEKWLKLDMAEFSANSHIDFTSVTGTVNHSGVFVAVPFGPWIADLQQRLYNGKGLGEVTIVEVEQKAEGTTKAFKKVREMKLIGGWIASMDHTWGGIQAAPVAMNLEFTDITFTWGDKVAVHNQSEKA
jgi:hypothetical protein